VSVLFKKAKPSPRAEAPHQFLRVIKEDDDNSKTDELIDLGSIGKSSFSKSIRSVSMLFAKTKLDAKAEAYRSVRTIKEEDNNSVTLKLIISERPEAIDEIESLLKQGANPNALYKGMSLLMYAAQKGHQDITKKLLEYDADRTKQDDFGRNPLMMAIERGHCNIVAELLNFGSDIHKKTADHKKIQITQKDRKGNTPLIYAANKFCSDCIKLLLNAKADILISNKKGETISSIFENAEYRIYDKFKSYCKKRLNYLASRKNNDPCYYAIAMPLYNLLNLQLCILDNSENPLKDLLEALNSELELTENKKQKQLCQKAIELSKKFIEKAYEDIAQCKNELSKHELPHKNKYSDLLKYASLKISSITS